VKKQIKNAEMEMLKCIAEKFTRHPDQLNGLSEADAEIISFKHRTSDFLILKIDGLYEELQQGLYVDPYLIGWMSITVTISDIAAVGANPFGVLMALQLPDKLIHDNKWYSLFQSGINDACAEYGVYILGGDTNNGSALSVTTSAAATIDNGKPMMRSGAQSGDLLYSSGKPGLGNAFAFSRFFDKDPDVIYQPKARLKESKVIKKFASACIDTSDGLFPAISILSEINHIGFFLHQDTASFINSDAKNICASAKLPFWIMLAGPHGDYELLFTIKPIDKNKFEEACHEASVDFIEIGEVIPDQKLRFISENKHIECGAADIANLFLQANSDVKKYFDLLMKQHIIWHKNNN
jgi:thiamine-monophosphate kinase